MNFTNTITIIGNLVDDPELRFTGSGVPVINYRIASTPRIFDRQANEWKDGDTLFISCQEWRQQAENGAETYKRGTRVIVVGELTQRQYETREGEKRTVFELKVEESGPSTKNQTAVVSKAGNRQAASQAPQQQQQAAPAPQQQQQSAPAGQPQQDPFAGPGAGFTPQPYAGAGTGPGF